MSFLTHGFLGPSVQSAHRHLIELSLTYIRNGFLDFEALDDHIHSYTGIRWTGRGGTMMGGVSREYKNITIVTLAENIVDHLARNVFKGEMPARDKDGLILSVQAYLTDLEAAKANAASYMGRENAFSWEFRLFVSAPDRENPKGFQAVIAAVYLASDIKDESAWYHLDTNTKRDYKTKIRAEKFAVTAAFDKSLSQLFTTFSTLDGYKSVFEEFYEFARKRAIRSGYYEPALFIQAVNDHGVGVANNGESVAFYDRPTASTIKDVAEKITNELRKDLLPDDIFQADPQELTAFLVAGFTNMKKAREDGFATYIGSRKPWGSFRTWQYRFIVAVPNAEDSEGFHAVVAQLALTTTFGAFMKEQDWYNLDPNRVLEFGFDLKASKFVATRDFTYPIEIKRVDENSDNATEETKVSTDI